MIRAAVLADGDGSKLQAILDAMYFREIPDFDLAAVIVPRKDTYAITRAVGMGIPAYTVDPELFPTATSHSLAISNKLKDMDIDLVILAGYELPLGVIPYQFKNSIIGTIPCLYPSFSEGSDDPCVSALELGLKITGATAYLCDGDGGVGGIILQKAVEILPEDTPDSLRRRITEDAEWDLLTQSVKLFCSDRLSVQGRRVVILPEGQKAQMIRKVPSVAPRPVPEAASTGIRPPQKAGMKKPQPAKKK